MILRPDSRRIAIPLVLALLTLAGCSPDRPTVPPPPPPELPATADDLALRWLPAAYADRDSAAYVSLLDERFRTVLPKATLDAFGWPRGTTFDRSTEAALHGRLFGGGEGVRSNGSAVGPVDSVAVRLLNRTTPWAAVVPEDDHFGDCPDARWASFQVWLEFHGDGGLLQSVARQMTLYAAPDSGSGTVGWRLLGVQEFGSFPKVDEDGLWGTVKAWFLPAAR